MKDNNLIYLLEKAEETSEIWLDECPENWGEFIDKQNLNDIQLQKINQLFDVDYADTKLKGITTNPNIIKDEIFRKSSFFENYLMEDRFNSSNLYQVSYNYIIQAVSNKLKKLWEKSDGEYGWISAQLNPLNATNKEKMLSQALEIAKLNENIVVKVPVTKEGCEVVEELASLGISTNGTFSFNVSQALAYAQSVSRGRKIALRSGLGDKPWVAVSTFMIGRFEFMGGLLDDAQQMNMNLSDTEIAWAGVAIAKRINELFIKCEYPVKLLLSSLSSDSPKFTTKTLEMNILETMGDNVIYTCRPSFIEQILSTQSALDDSGRQNSIHEPVPEIILAKLKKIPYFESSLDPIGYKRESFDTNLAFLNTIAESLNSTEKATNFIYDKVVGL